jgi:hypothetical protein
VCQIVKSDKRATIANPPRKEFVSIQGGGHIAVFMRSDQFLQELIARVRPLAVHSEKLHF